MSTNMNLLSAANESKTSGEVRQQIPVKLSSKLSVSSSGGKEKDKKKGGGALKQVRNFIMSLHLFLHLNKCSSKFIRYSKLPLVFRRLPP